MLCYSDNVGKELKYNHYIYSPLQPIAMPPVQNNSVVPKKQAPRYSSTITHSVLQDHALHTSAMAHSVLHQYITDYAQETMPDTDTGTDTLC